MRDTLTAFAGVVILVLITALAVPPFLDWSGHRGMLERAVAVSLGIPVQSDGRIEIRLLPSPRVRFDHLRFGDASSDVAFDANFVKAELALTPLLKGEFRFTETRIGRGEIKLLLTDSDAILVPSNLHRIIEQRDLVIEDLHIQQLVLTTRVPSTGRTDQMMAENVHVRASALVGPWQVEGTSSNIPFRIATGALADNTLNLKLIAGEENRPRLDADIRVLLKESDTGLDAQAAASGQSRSLSLETEGTMRLARNPAQATVSLFPFSLSGKFKARGPIVRFESVNAEIDPRGYNARFVGSARVDLRAWRATLKLDSRRVDIDGLVYSAAGQALARQKPLFSDITFPMTLDLEMKTESFAFGFDEWSDLNVKATIGRSGALTLHQLNVVAPGNTRLQATGDVEFLSPMRFNGDVELQTNNSQSFGRYIQKLGFEWKELTVLDGRSLDLSTHASATSSDISFSNLRLALGDAKVAGNIRYLRPQNQARGRVEAQLSAEGFDLEELPSIDNLVGEFSQYDVGLTIEAHRLRLGSFSGNSAEGRVSAHLQSKGTGVSVDNLSVAGLAGVTAKLKGEIAEDGSGRVGGHLNARKAEPILTLLEKAWLPAIGSLPEMVRKGSLDLDVMAERAGSKRDTLRSTARGKIAGTTIDLSVLTRLGDIEAVTLNAAVEKTNQWFGGRDIGFDQPGRFSLSAKTRSGASSDRLDVSVSAMLAGLDVSTTQPLVFERREIVPESGTLRLQTADTRPFLKLGKIVLGEKKIAADISVAISKRNNGLHSDIDGLVDKTALKAQIDKTDGGLTGEVSVERISLPFLIETLVMPINARDARSDSADMRPESGSWYLPMNLAVKAATAVLGEDIVAREARFGLRASEGELGLQGLTATIGNGRVEGNATIARQDGKASMSGQGHLQDVMLGNLVADSPIHGKLSATGRYSATGQTADALTRNLGGAGEITLSDLRIDGAEPSAITGVVARALTEDDPLRDGRIPKLLADELSKGPFVAKDTVSVSATVVAGKLRTAPFVLDAGSAQWNGSFVLSLPERSLEARGSLVSNVSSKGWSGGKPSIQLGFSGPLTALRREIDAGSLTNGLSALVLQRELEKIELAEADQAERIRRRSRVDMDQARAAAIKAAAERAAREKAEEAARQARLRAQQAAAEEAARQARDRQNAEDESRRIQERDGMPMRGGPLDGQRPPL